MKKNLFLVGLCTVFLLVTATNLLSAPKGGITLSGTYYLQGTSTCVQTPFGSPGSEAPLGFDSTFKLELPATTRSRHIEGTLVLNRDGTGTATMHRGQIIHQRLFDGVYNSDTPIIASSWECDVSYETLPDGTSTMTFEGCTGQYVSPSSGLPIYTEDSSYTLGLMVSGSMLFLSGTNPVWEPEVYSEGISTLVKAEKECFRTWTAVRIGN